MPVDQIELAHITKMTLCCPSSVLVNEPPLFTWVDSEYHMHSTSRLMGVRLLSFFPLRFPQYPLLNISWRFHQLVPKNLLCISDADFIKMSLSFHSVWKNITYTVYITKACKSVRMSGVRIGCRYDHEYEGGGINA